MEYPCDECKARDREIPMIDREKVIKAIEICYAPEHHCVECPLFSEEACNDKMMHDALDLLKTQEAVPVVQHEVMHMLAWCCGSCGVAITDGDKFCRKCGHALKWNNRRNGSMNEILEPVENLEVQKPPMGVKPYYIAAWQRIGELAKAIERQYESSDGDTGLVEKWANEISWQASMIEALRDENED